MAESEEGDSLDGYDNDAWLQQDDPQCECKSGMKNNTNLIVCSDNFMFMYRTLKKKSVKYK